LLYVPFFVVGFVVLLATTTQSTYDPNTGLITDGGTSGAGVGVFLLLVVGGFVFFLYQLYRQGRTGQTIGMKVVGIRLVRERDGRYIGFWMALVRTLAHFFDSFFFDLGYLWPLWDKKRQTFADKLCRTIVIRE
jgi:uncharacterized RDD family membrane protein YckC